MPAIKWAFFFGACLLTGALLLPRIPPLPVASGMAFAAAIMVAWHQIRRPPTAGPPD